ncbi:hypothetical protein LTR36_004163 [Oleoguttula mirabilis]|uniref:Uncharacterized protein n=1 Tax=Oleoguttula mirabilis TaxID=1507867 RepID=A0AAV9JIA8_9PEZI|nr:hypothetical protein LTR36_004163 [Oleoguttula mirabilis]
MSGIIKKIEQKLGDHPNVSSDPSVNPTSGIGIGANQGDDPNKSWVQNKKEAGMGADSRMVEGENARHIHAGSTTSPDTKGAAEASGLGNNI